MNIKPLSDYVVVKPIDPGEKKHGDIIIPDTAKEKPQEGEVINVGPGKRTNDGKNIPMEVKKGDKVLYGKYSGTNITLDNTDYLILRETDIYAII